ncbi:MAG: ABC transporter substrate-binding protein [Proteobacteria bacterium]|nr:ABC transporter substrate-binding protein [Pseudomonadota bacterium]
MATALGNVPLHAAATPSATVEIFHSALLESMKAAAPTQRRFEVLASVMDNTFDFQVMIKTATGRYWRDSADAERSSLLAAFRKSSIASYVAQFSSFSDESFSTGTTRDGPAGTRIVEALLVTASRSVKFVYVLRQREQTWWIIDVLLDAGISQLAVRTAEFGRTLKDGGVQKLTKALSDQAERLIRG